MRPRILCVPMFTEVEWAIASQLAEWAEVATFDAPGVGDEPSPTGDPADFNRSFVVDRALREVDRLGWDSYFVAGDAWGTATAVLVASARPEQVQGIALGHATLTYQQEGQRAPINKEVTAAMTQLLRSDFDSFVRYGMTQITQGGFDEEISEKIVARFPPMELASSIWETNAQRDEPIGDVLATLDIPVLLVKHEGCIVFSEEGYEDAIRALPDARRTSVGTAPSASDEFASAIRDFCEQVIADR